MEKKSELSIISFMDKKIKDNRNFVRLSHKFMIFVINVPLLILLILASSQVGNLN